MPRSTHFFSNKNDAGSASTSASSSSSSLVDLANTAAAAEAAVLGGQGDANATPGLAAGKVDTWATDRTHIGAGRLMDGDHFGVMKDMVSNPELDELWTDPTLLPQLLQGMAIDGVWGVGCGVWVYLCRGKSSEGERHSIYNMIFHFLTSSMLLSSPHSNRLPYAQGPPRCCGHCSQGA